MVLSMICGCMIGVGVCVCVCVCTCAGVHVCMHVRVHGVGRHWWFNYLGPLLDVELTVYLVRLDWLPLPCITLFQPNH